MRIAALIVIFAFALRGATIWTNNAAMSGIQGLINGANNRDTIIVTNATADVEQTVELNKPITLLFTNVTLTITNSTRAFTLTTVADETQRLSGVTIEMASGVPSFNTGYVVTEGSGWYRIDHNRFLSIKTPMKLKGYSRGLVDQNVFLDTHKIEFWHDEWAGDTRGDASWSEPFTIGTSEQHVVENNTISNAVSDAATDTYGGARYTYRFNLLNRATVATHGTQDGSGRSRGAAHGEIYYNHHTSTPSTSKNTIHIRGGTFMHFGDTSSGVSKGITVHYYRQDARVCGKFSPSPNAFDRIDLTDGAGTPGGAGDGVWAVGTAGAGSGNLTLEAPGSGWTDDQWIGWMVVVSNSTTHPNTYWGVAVEGNDADTITVGDDNAPSTCPHVFNEGEGFALIRILLPLDGVGAGPGGLLTDKAVTPTPTNLNQPLISSYIWGVTINGSRWTISPGNGSDQFVFNDFHYFCEDADGSFDGTGGVGIGSLEQMSAITPNVTLSAIRTNRVAFWATNAPDADWNKSNSTTNDGALYVWDGDSWERYYVPLQYPHPMAEAGSESPEPPAQGNRNRIRVNHSKASRMLLQ